MESRVTLLASMIDVQGFITFIKDKLDIVVSPIVAGDHQWGHFASI